jgi:hypothetical protein
MLFVSEGVSQWGNRYIRRIDITVVKPLLALIVLKLTILLKNDSKTVCWEIKTNLKGKVTIR